jgi:putative FmdB family regulatory protein
MPTYQYRCDKCGHEFEEFQSIVEDPLEKCPECDGSVHRIISGGAGLIFKGSGFYITDYNRGKYNADKAKEKSSGASDSKTSGSSSSGSA